MKRLLPSRRVLIALALLLVPIAGCETTDGGGTYVSGGVYYGVGFYDPWYYGGSYDDVDIIVTPPEDRPNPPTDRPNPPPRPTHPIAPTPTPRPTPMPSIPRTPMPRARGR